MSRDECSCHSSCGACVFDGSFPGPNDCISCSDGKAKLTPMWSDGSGTCGEAKIINQQLTNHEGDGTYYDSYGYNYNYYDSQYTVSYVDYENSCLCQDVETTDRPGEEYNFFSWMSDFFAWLSSLFGSAG